MKLTAKEYLKKVKITTTVNNKEEQLEEPSGLSQLLEDYHQAKLNDLSLQNVSESLLSKYIKHVSECEGVDFISDCNSHMSDVEFSSDEIETLRRLS